MRRPIDHDAVAALAEQPLDWRYKGLPAEWWDATPAQICGRSPELFSAGAVGPVCVLRASALTHNLVTMARWCRRRGVELAPHGKTHMAPQLLVRQFDAGAVAVTAATVSQVRVLRAFGVRDVLLANEVVDAAGLAWLAREMAADPEFRVVCWVDSARGVELMSAALTDAVRPLDVCVEVGMAGGRTGCRTAAEVDAVARAVTASPRLRLVGVAGYEAARGHDVGAEALAAVTAHLTSVRAAVERLAGRFETEEVLVTAGGSTYFDLVADVLTGDWPAGLTVRTVLRSGCYLTHDDGLYARTSPLRRAGTGGLIPAMSVWAQVLSRPEDGLALLGMGRRDVSFDQGLPVAKALRDSQIDHLNDQHAYLRVGADDVGVGDWLEFGLSHPCTTFDKWALIPVLDDDNRVVDLIRTFF
ncbi:amino acid deaminase [Mycobacterium sp. IS-1496]|uniref:alanine racemase n=1 Tax=Mycobacterium sp. IS-1496 TaxID=1772284 RepID=UPI0007415F76|nr:alanine racemase [Mycobacterium sp. IS-1496]KUI35341.1 amino acid deaminase [Mycobacterium sp. IS-1496]